MKIKGIIFEDFINYKKASMTIMMPQCDFKCDKENKCNVCQNSHLANEPDIDTDIKNVVDNYYLTNDITESIVFQGLEPFDSWEDLKEFIKYFITVSNDDIVIYTGYTESEIKDKCEYLADLVGNKNNCIVKFGRYIPNRESKYDNLLEINLASDNQYSLLINK